MIRGNDKKDIFIDEQDKIYFIEILKTQKEENRYGLIAFCIMDNHAHLIMQEKEEELAKEIDTIKGLKKFTNMDENDIFIDIDAKANRMEEKQAKKLWDEINKKENTVEKN